MDFKPKLSTNDQFEASSNDQNKTGTVEENDAELQLRV